MSLQEKLDNSIMGKIRISPYVLSYEHLKDSFQNALVWYNQGSKACKSSVVIETLVTPDGQPTERACPRDVDSARLIKNGELYQGWEICQFCENSLTCMTDGRTKQFKLLTTHASNSQL